MGILPMKIGKKRVVLIIAFFFLSFWTFTGQAAVDDNESASAEVVKRLDINADISAKINSIFAEYEPKIRAAEKTINNAFNKYIDAKHAFKLKKVTEAAVNEAEKQSNDEVKKYRDMYHERDIKIQQLLPSALADKYNLGIKIIAGRNAKRNKVLDEQIANLVKDYDNGIQRTEEEKKKIEEEMINRLVAIEKEYSSKLDAQVGKVKNQGR